MKKSKELIMTKQKAFELKNQKSIYSYSITIDYDDFAWAGSVSLNFNHSVADILHLVMAKKIGVDYFVTNDDKLFKIGESLKKDLSFKSLLFNSSYFNEKDIKKLIT